MKVPVVRVQEEPIGTDVVASHSLPGMAAQPPWMSL
jgi:hypothetical protein